MELDRFKNTWKELDRRLERLSDGTDDTARRVARGKVRSVQSQLARTFLFNGILALVGVVITVMATRILALPMWLTAVMTVYVMLMGGLSMFMYGRVHGHDFISEPTVQAVAYALWLQRLRLRIIAVGLCCGALVLGAFFWVIAADSGMPALYGGLTGLTVGAILGWMKYRRQTLLLRTLTAEIKSITAE